MTLAEQIMSAAAFENCDGNDPQTERGRQIAHASLRPLLTALADCVGALEAVCEAESEANKATLKRLGLKQTDNLIGGDYKVNAAYYSGERKLAQLRAHLTAEGEG